MFTGMFHVDKNEWFHMKNLSVRTWNLNWNRIVFVHSTKIKKSIMLFCPPLYLGFIFILKLADAGCTTFSQNDGKHVLVVGGHNKTNMVGNSVFMYPINKKTRNDVNDALSEVSKKYK